MHVLQCFHYAAEVRFAAIHIQISVSVAKDKLYEFGSIPYTNPTLNLPDSVNKCKSNIKTYSLMQPCYFNFFMQI